jgi:transcriptional regulator with XRE-family HTH domain
MDHREIRAIRGNLSRAAFAKLLGVTSLTVLRWELGSDNKEARRPRPKLVEALQRLAAEGVGSSGESGPSDDEEDDDASEPILAPASLPAAAQVDEEARLAPLLEQLMGDGWRAAEDELLRLVSSGQLTSAPGRVLATLGLLQVQLLARLDVRGALMALLPALEEVERGAVSPAIAGRAHALAALLYGAPDSRFFDVGRVNAHADKADALLDPAADDWRVVLATARISAARFLGPSLVMRAYQLGQQSLERATAPLPRFLALGLRSLVAAHRGDAKAAFEYGEEGLRLAERLGLWPLVIAVLADRAWRALHGSASPDEVLEITARARKCAEEHELPPGEPLIRVLGCEIEALVRKARFAEANATLELAEAAAKRGAVTRYALAMPVLRLLTFTNRVSELDGWAASLEAECVGSQRALANVHAVLVRACAASLNGAYELADEQLSRVCGVPDTTTGIDYLAHDAHFEHVLAKLLRRDLPGTQAALRRAFDYVEQHPSVWHTALYQRMDAFALLAVGRFAEARQKLETTSAAFTLLGDVVQVVLAKAGVAMIARAAGAPDAEPRLRETLEQVQQLGIWSPQMLRRAQAISAPPPKEPWREESLTERLVGAIERLRIRGLSPEQYLRGLAVILGELFPGREAIVGGSEVDDGQGGVVDLGEGGEGSLRFGLRGKLRADELAALRILAAFVPKSVAVPLAIEPDLAVDTVLPHFVAASSASRELKAEIARLSRSSATILIGGESGSGKEVVARAVHELSSRADRPYVVFNCASVPHDLFESQLFGHRKGAFTGATADSAGVIGAADGGTLFLDEIGELPLATQPKLLRFLENGEIFPIGEQRPRRVDVRVLAATHRDLEALVKAGRFREDLYYRLNVVPLYVAPLRERREDIVALAHLFVARLSPDPAAVPRLGADAVKALQSYAWPGNVRELRNVVERAMAYAPVPAVLRAEHLRIPS